MNEVKVMSAWREARSPALKIEEAALLPALPRLGTGGAALKKALEKAPGTGKVQLLPVANAEARDAQAAAPGEHARPRVRAALRHMTEK